MQIFIGDKTFFLFCYLHSLFLWLVCIVFTNVAYLKLSVYWLVDLIGAAPKGFPQKSFNAMLENSLNVVFSVK